MEIILQCQRVALKCRKLENKRVEILQNAADEIDCLSQHIQILKQSIKCGVSTWTKSFKRTFDKFETTNYEIDYNESMYILPYDEYYRKQDINVHLKSFQTYNKLLSQHETLLHSNKLLVGSLSNEIERLYKLILNLRHDVLILYHQNTVTYSKNIVNGYTHSFIHSLKSKYYSFPCIPSHIIYEIYRFYRNFEFSLLNYYYNDEDDDTNPNNNGIKYDNLLLQNTNINNKHNISIYYKAATNKSEMIVIDNLLCYENKDIISFHLRIYGKPAIGFMKEIIYRKKKSKKKRYNRNEYILVNGQQSSLLLNGDYHDDIPLKNDTKQIFKYIIDTNAINTIFHGINDVFIYVNMIQKMATITIKSLSNHNKQMIYNFNDLPNNIYCVTRINSNTNKIAIL